MTTRSQATAASGEITIDGKIYRMSPLSDKDIGELDNWIRIRVIRLARQALTGEETEIEKRGIMGAAFEYATSLTWLDKGVEEMGTLSGVARLLWQVLKRNHPELTTAGLETSIVEGEINIDESMDVFDLLHNITGKKKPQIQKRTKKKKPKKRRGKLVGRRSTRP